MNLTKLILTLGLFACVFVVNVESKELTEQQTKDIKMLREELEFLATKLLRITGEEEYTTTHEGHEMLIFGTCGTATTNGINIDCVSADSTAEKLGLKAGDLLVMINQKSLVGLNKNDAYQRYADIVTAFKKGDSVAVTYIQNGQTKSSRGTIESFYSPTYSFSVSAKREQKSEK